MEGATEGATRRTRLVASLLIVGLAAGPAATHLYWLLGGAWGLGGSDSSTGIRVVAALVLLLIVAAVFVVLARVGLWRQTLVSDRVIRILAWALAGFFLAHGLVSFAEMRVASEWWLYGPSGLVIGLLALIVAGSGGAWPPLVARKYGVVYRVITGLTSLNRWLRRKPGVESVTIAIVPPPR